MTSKLAALVGELKESDVNAQDIYSKLGSRLKKKKTLTAQLPPDVTEPIARDLIGKNVECADAALIFLSQIHSVVLKNGSDARALDSLFSVVLLTTASERCVSKCLPVVFESMFGNSFVDVCHRVVCKEKKELPLAVKHGILPLASKFAWDQENLGPDHESCRAKMVGIVLVFTVDTDLVLRKIAITALRDFITDCPIQSSHVTTVISCLKNVVVPKLDRFTGNEESLLDIIGDHVPLYLRVIGISLRKSSSLTNAILKIMELGFRHAAVSVKAAAFNSWKSFIDELSADLEILSSARYMNLVMQPLVAAQSIESLDILRIKTLWGLANRLRNKLPALFSAVCLPILHCCLGNLDCSRARSDAVAASNIKGSRSSNNASGFYAAMQATGYRATPKKASKSSKLHDIGVEVLIRLLAYPEDNDSDKTSDFTIAKLDNAFLATPAIFGTYGAVLIATVEEVLRSKSNITADLSLLLWDRLHRHLKSHLESNLQKNKREPELFNLLFLALKNIAESQNWARSNPRVTFSMFQSFLEFPASVLSSTFYGGHLNGKHGFPVLTLIKMLFSGRLTCVLSARDHAVELWDFIKRLVAVGFESMVGFLSFCGSVIEILASYAQDVLAKEKEDTDAYRGCTDLLFKTWAKLGSGLNDHIVQSQEVNQGDNFDHDFTAAYGFLLFPLHLNRYCEDCDETWDCVYEVFLWASQFVATCKPNELCRHLCSCIRQRLDRGGVSDSVLTFLVGACKTMVAKADYNHRGVASRQRVSRLDQSPSPKRQSLSESLLERHKNLSDLCAVMLRLFEASRENNVTKHYQVLMSSLSQVFYSIYYSEDIRILFRTFAPAFKNILSSEFEDEKVLRQSFKAIFEAVRSVYSGAAVEKDSFLFHGDFHDFISNCVKNGGVRIRNAAAEFWKEVVVDSQHHGLICDTVKNDVKSCLFPVYQKMGWDCPWKDVELPATMDLTEFDDNTQSLEVVGYGAFGSPAKKNLVPKSPHKSPLRPAGGKTVSSPFAVKRKLDDVSDSVNYVNRVSPYPKPRTPLTERQKEKLAEREFIPTMYNELDERQEQEIDVDTQDAPIADDVIESSQSRESPRKRLKVDAGTRNTDESDVDGSVDESRNVDTTLDKSERMDNIAEDSVVSGLNADDSYECVEMHDESTNRTRSNETISAEYEDTDLGVKPLDDSYECVAVADMSVCAAKPTLTVRNSGKDENSDSAIADSCVKEVSVCLEHLSADFDKTPAAKSKRGRPPKKVPVSKIRAKRGKKIKGAMSDAESCADTNSPAVRRSKRTRNVKSKEKDDNVSEKCAIEVADTSQSDGVNDHDTTEYEYVAVADSSSSNLTMCASDKAKTVDLKDKIQENVSADGAIDSTNSKEGDGANDHDTTDYEYVAVVDSSSSNLTMCGTADDTKIDTDEDTEDSVATATDNLNTTEDAERPSAPTCNATFVVEPDSDEDYFLDARASIGGPSDSQPGLTISESGISANPSSVNAGYESAGDASTADESAVSVSSVNAGYESAGDASTADESAVSVSSVNAGYESTGDASAADESVVSLSSVNAGYESTGDAGTADDSVVSVSRSSLNAGNESTGSAGAVDESVASLSSVNAGCESAGDASDADESVASVNSSCVIVGDGCTGEPSETIPDYKSPDADLAISSGVNEVSSCKKTDTQIGESLKSENSDSDREVVDSGSIVKETVDQSTAITDVSASTVTETERADASSRKSDADHGDKEEKVTALESGCFASPNSKSILKRRSSVMEPDQAGGSSPVIKKRVSFATSIAGPGCHVQQSPRSSLLRKRSSPKVSRRLSLQPDRMTVHYCRENGGVVSPLSVRSAQVKEAIANIRAKDSSSPSGHHNASVVGDFHKSMRDLREILTPAFVRSLTKTQSRQLNEVLSSASRELFEHVCGT